MMAASATGADISGDGGCLKTIITEGESSQGTPPPGSKVKVHYVGTLLDGSKFDSSRDRPGHFEFTIGQGQVIKGWDVGVATMHKGEKATLLCRHDYAYGEHGSPPKIPGNATLNFEVELFSWKEQRKQKWQLPDPDERIDEAAKYKAKGTEAFKAGNFGEAQEWYHDAADLLISEGDADFSAPEERAEEAAALLLSCQLNEAQMCLRQEDWPTAVTVCTGVLERDPQNFKALFRRGSALAKQAAYADARRDLLAASKRASPPTTPRLHAPVSNGAHGSHPACLRRAQSTPSLRRYATSSPRARRLRRPPRPRIRPSLPRCSDERAQRRRSQ